MFELASGDYKFSRCSDRFILKGVGFVKIDGCSIQFEDLEVDHRVVASVNDVRSGRQGDRRNVRDTEHNKQHC
jgi:hypothetical protein